MTPSGLPALICDTGLLSRVMLGRSPFVEAYEIVLGRYTPVISTAVYVELQHWLQIQRGAIEQPISRAEYDRHRYRLDSYVVLNSDGVSSQAMTVARRWPDTGVGDWYTITTALVFDVPVFTLNPKNFQRVNSLLLYKPDDYKGLLASVKRKA